jgi:hypothetical protein
VIFEVIAALKVSNSLSVQRWSQDASGLRWHLTLQRAVFPEQIVIALEKLCLRIKNRPTLGETARLAMQRRYVLTNRPIQAFQKLGRDLFERNQFRYAEDDPSGH